MSAYLVCTIRVDDTERYKAYTARTPAIIAKHGGRFVVRGGPVETLEGADFKDRLVVVEFPSAEAVRTFYASPEYQEVRAIRASAADAVFLLAEGVPEGDAAPDAKVVASG